jgi:hypothetical protein
MYPTIYHALLDLFGIDWGWTRLLNSFGFFVALAFVAASYLWGLELKRKAEQGLFQPTVRTVVKGGKPDWTEIVTSGLMGSFTSLFMEATYLHRGQTHSSSCFLWMEAGSSVWL